MSPELERSDTSPDTPPASQPPPKAENQTPTQPLSVIDCQTSYQVGAYSPADFIQRPQDHRKRVRRANLNRTSRIRDAG